MSRYLLGAPRTKCEQAGHVDQRAHGPCARQTAEEHHVNRLIPRVVSTLKPDLSNWDPEHAETWDSRLAWRTLWITTFSMALAFAAWYLVSAIAPRLNDIGFNLSISQLYWLVALPGLAAGLLRLVFMFLPPILGTRTLVALASALLLLPMIGWTLVVRDTSTPY